MPKLTTNKKNRARDDFRDASREVYMSVLKNLFASVIEAQQQGGFMSKRVKNICFYVGFLMSFFPFRLDKLTWNISCRISPSWSTITQKASD